MEYWISEISLSTVGYDMVKHSKFKEMTKDVNI
jgi:hypothetical protein